MTFSGVFAIITNMMKIQTIELADIWQKDKRIEKWRAVLIPLIQEDLAKSKIKYDGQDLEHQVLFRMLTDENLKLDEVLREQKEIVLERMRKTKI